MIYVGHTIHQRISFFVFFLFFFIEKKERKNDFLDLYLKKHKNKHRSP